MHFASALPIIVSYLTLLGVFAVSTVGPEYVNLAGGEDVDWDS